MTEPLSPKRLAEIRERLAAATPAPWITHQPADDHDCWWVWRKDALPYYGGVLNLTERREEPGSIGSAGITDGDDLAQEHADAEFIAHAPTDLADLLAEVERLQGEVEEWKRAALEMHATAGEYATDCDAKQARIDAALALHQQYRPVHRDDTDICTACSQYPVDVPYPCATYRALRGDDA